MCKVSTVHSTTPIRCEICENFFSASLFAGYIFLKSPKLPRSTPQNLNGPPVVEKGRFLFANKSLFHLASIAEIDGGISKFVPPLSGNLALNNNAIISFDRSHIGQPRSKTRRNCKIKKFIFAVQWSLLLCSLFWYHHLVWELSIWAITW